jgi:hypothetical protein
MRRRLLGLCGWELGTHMHSGDIGADGSTDGAAYSCTDGCAYSCTDGGADCCADCGAEWDANCCTDGRTYWCTDGQAHSCAHGYAHTCADYDADSCADASPLWWWVARMPRREERWHLLQVWPNGLVMWLRSGLLVLWGMLALPSGSYVLKDHVMADGDTDSAADTAADNGAHRISERGAFCGADWRSHCCTYGWTYCCTHCNTHGPAYFCTDSQAHLRAYCSADSCADASSLRRRIARMPRCVRWGHLLQGRGRQQRLVMRLRSGLLVLCEMWSSTLGTHLHSCDIGAVGSTDGAAYSCTDGCAYSCTDGGTYGCADCGTNGRADIGAYGCTISEAHCRAYRCAHCRTDG